MAALAIPMAIKAGSALIGGLQTRSAINDSEAALIDSYVKAGMTVSEAVQAVNKNLYNNADVWGNKVTDAGNAAADSATAAAERGITGVKEAVASGQGMMQPYQAAGSSAADTLSKLLQKPEQFRYQADPGYQFRLNEGMKQIQRSAAAHGASGGGGTAKALAQYNSGLAAQEYGNAWDRWNKEGQQRRSGLETLAGLGERAGEFSGDMGFRGSEFNANLGENAAQYGGNMKTGTTQWAGNLWSHSTDEMSGNSLDLANFLANMDLATGRTKAWGNMSRAGIWNDVIGKGSSAGLDFVNAFGKQKKWGGFN